MGHPVLLHYHMNPCTKVFLVAFTKWIGDRELRVIDDLKLDTIYGTPSTTSTTYASCTTVLLAAIIKWIGELGAGNPDYLKLDTVYGTPSTTSTTQELPVLRCFPCNYQMDRRVEN